MLGRTAGFLQTVLRNHLGQHVPPRVLTYTVTFGCNARCIMCDSWKMPRRDELSCDELGRIFDQLPRMDAVRLTGGEPFVRADLAEIGQLVQQRLRPLLVHITTNGFLTDRIVRYCEQRDRRIPLYVLVSVDGVGEKHNQVRGSSLAWKTVTETLQSLAPRRQDWNLRLGVNQTIVDAEGVEHYRRLREVLRPLGVYNNVVMAYDASATYNLEQEVDLAPAEIGQFQTFGEFTEADLRQLLDDVAEDLAELPWMERIAKRYYLRGIRSRLLEGRGDPNPKCAALHSHLRIFPNGDVPTCQFNSRVVGNLRQQSFAEVWRNVRTEEQRRWVRQCPGCWAECEVLPSALYTLDLLRPARRNAPAVTKLAAQRDSAVPAETPQEFVTLQHSSPQSRGSFEK